MTAVLRRWSRTLAGRGRERDRGALSLELMMVFPAVLLLVMLAVHVGLWWHARNVALAAAQQGVERARVRGASIGAGTAEAQSFVGRAGGSISGAQVSGSRGGQTVRIEVSGHVDTLIPGLKLPVSQHAEAATERITQP
ncbi:TadE/TadG family type IV pilus assembly protein [Streptomyces syringium]|uniref:TadE/TadG family type IV pilus assembly protein n=1 Tax=Streptomyces syringium TaxID=76729 RepID=UPI0033CB6BE3